MNSGVIDLDQGTFLQIIIVVPAIINNHPQHWVVQATIIDMENMLPPHQPATISNLIRTTELPTQLKPMWSLWHPRSQVT